MIARCRSELAPPLCCQPEPLTAEQVAGIEYRNARRRETYRAELCRRCPLCGSRYVYPSLKTDRRTWLCADCFREFSPGAIG